MSDDSFGHAPDHSFLARPDIPVTSVPDSFGQEPPENPRLAKLSSEVRRLYTWLGLLTGISILSLGLLAGFAFWLKLQQDKVQQQLAGLNAYKAEVERLKTLESRIDNLDTQNRSINQNLEVLNQQVAKGLPTQLQGVEKEIASVKAALQRVQFSPLTREQPAPILQNLPKGQPDQRNLGNPFPLQQLPQPQPQQQPQQPKNKPR